MWSKQKSTNKKQFANQRKRNKKHKIYFNDFQKPF